MCCLTYLWHRKSFQLVSLCLGCTRYMLHLPSSAIWSSPQTPNLMSLGIICLSLSSLYSLTYLFFYIKFTSALVSTYASMCTELVSQGLNFTSTICCNHLSLAMAYHHCILLFLLNAGFLYTDHIVVNKIIIRWDVLFNGIMEGFIWHLRLWCILCICLNCLDALLFLIFEETHFWKISRFWTNFALVSTGWASEAFFVSIITT